MNILFVCCCLEPGEDGVGDYTRRLAGEVARQGHTCSLLALADRRINGVTRGSFAESGAELPFLRLPFAMPWMDRVGHARRFREDFAPDWISWQIVLYGFDPQGLSFGLGSHCRAIAGDARNQIMFHEIWIGLSRDALLKSKAVGWLQQRIIRRLLRELRPGVVHTHTPLYRFFMRNIGQPTVLLPLFGNIPRGEPRAGWLDQKLAATDAPLPVAGPGDGIVFVIFGTIHAEWDPVDFVTRARAATRAAGRNGLVLVVGRPGFDGARIVDRLKELATDDFAVRSLGALPEDEVSQALSAADLGVSTVPPEYLFKSGTAAAMIEHGLPVVATRPSYSYAKAPAEIQGAVMPHTLRTFELDAPRPKPGSLLPEVARQFLADLSRAGQGGGSLKILLTSLFFAPSIGGIETVSQLLAREFVNAGHEVKVATNTPAAGDADLGFEILRQPSFGQLLRAARWCDVYLQNNISLPLAAPLAVVRRPWFIVHQTWIPRWGGTVGRINRAKLFLLRHARSIAISQAVAADMPTPSIVIPNPYDADVFFQRDDAVRTGDLVALGRLVSDKGFDLLIEALALLQREGLRPKLALIGDGPERADLERQAAELGVAGQVDFLGQRTGPALAEELNRHRIAVVPSRWKEPFGIVALEAIACGCIVVGSQDGGLRDAIGPCGVTFPNGDASALAAALRGLLASPEALAPFRKHMAAHLARHHPTTVARAYLDLFRGKPAA